MRGCLFCGGTGPFTTVEHTVPEALGNDDSVLLGEVCDGCQSYLGREVEKFALSQPPIGPMRALLRIRGKRGKLPTIETSIPERHGGHLPAYDFGSDQGITFGVGDDGHLWVAIERPEMVRAIMNGEKTEFKFVLTPKHIAALGRLLGKMALELLCAENPLEAREPRYDELRRYVRFGVRKEIWLLAYRQACNYREIIETGVDGLGPFETVTCYEYGFYDVGTDRIFAFMFGGEVWAISMDGFVPCEASREVFASELYRPVWSSREGRGLTDKRYLDEVLLPAQKHLRL